MDNEGQQSGRESLSSDEIAALTHRIKEEIERYRQEGNFLRLAGTSGAIAGSAASLLPIAVGATALWPIIGLGVAGFALIKQKARDEHIYRIETQLSDILASPDVDSQANQLAALLQEISEAKAGAQQALHRDGN